MKTIERYLLCAKNPYNLLSENTKHFGTGLGSGSRCDEGNNGSYHKAPSLHALNMAGLSCNVIDSHLGKAAGVIMLHNKPDSYNHDYSDYMFGNGFFDTKELEKCILRDIISW